MIKCCITYFLTSISFQAGYQYPSPNNRRGVPCGFAADRANRKRDPGLRLPAAGKAIAALGHSGVTAFRIGLVRSRQAGTSALALPQKGRRGRTG